MSRSRIPDVDVSTSPIKARPPAVRPPSARINSARARSAQQQQPIKHEPCSSTLAKFHDSVNFSVLGDAHATRQSPRHPILEAKEKYKYMPRQKSYCDESLFASNTPRLNHDNHYAGNRITHEYMSNYGPMTFSAPLRTNRPDSARSAIGNVNEILPPKSERTTRIEKPYVKPWR